MLLGRSITIKLCQDADLKAFLVNSFDLSSALHIIKHIALHKLLGRKRPSFKTTQAAGHVLRSHSLL